MSEEVKPLGKDELDIAVENLEVLCEAANEDKRSKYAQIIFMAVAQARRALELEDEKTQLKIRAQDLERTVHTLNGAMDSLRAASGDIYRKSEAEISRLRGALELAERERDAAIALGKELTSGEQITVYAQVGRNKKWICGSTRSFGDSHSGIAYVKPITKPWDEYKAALEGRKDG